jgi:virginiamycin B lyase
MVSVRFILMMCLTAFLAACGDDAPPEQTEVKITEWEVPYPDSRPRDPYVSSENKVWFVGQRTGYLAYFNPETEEFTQIMLPEGSGPHNIIADDEGVAWYAGNLLGWIGRVDLDGSLTTIMMPNPEARDPHTLVEDGNGNIWFTVQGGNFMGRLNKTTLQVDLIPSLTEVSRPYGIIVAPDGVPWVVLFGTNKLARIDPDTLELTEIPLPRTDARPRRLMATSDGIIWYVDYAAGFLGRYDPDEDEFEEYAMPSGPEAKPYGMAVDDKDRIWFVEVGPQPNKFVGFHPGSKSFFSVTEIESGGGAVRHMMYHQPTNTVWFGTDANTLGRAELPD